MIFSPGSFWGNLLAASIALAPALLCVLSGRALERMSDDAALAERLWAHRQRILQVTIVAGVVLALLLPRTWPWSLPLMILGRALAGYRIRRTLYGETWGLGRYLYGVGRFYAAFLGFWILLGGAPAIIRHQRWWVAAAIAAILAAWNWWYPAVALRLVGARPFVPAELDPLFESVVSRSHVPRPSLWRAGPTGAVMANAVALPSLRGSSVLFSETLLAGLTAEEVAAIFAHEVAHLEHFRRRVLVRAHAAVLVLIVLGTVLVPAQGNFAPAMYLPVTLLWPIVLLFYLAFRMQVSQQHELASDLRAVELCGNPRALASALVKVHAIGRMPRRWELQLERSASHPSLARRLQAILGTSESPAAPVAGTEIFRTDEPGVFLAFDSAALTEFREVPTECAATPEALTAAAGQISTTRFSSIAELRVSAAGTAAPQLVLIDRSGARRSLRMRREDLGRLQHILDRVDLLLPSPPKALFAGRAIGSIAASVTAICALTAGPVWSVVVITLLAAFRPSARMVLNAAAASALAAVLILGGRGDAGPPACNVLVLLAGTLPLAGVAIWLGVRLIKAGEDTGPKEPAWVLWFLAMSGVAACAIPAVLAQGSLLLLSDTSGTVIGAIVLPFAAAVALLQAGRRNLQVAGLVFAIAATLPLLAGTTWFRETVVGDPLLSAAPQIPVSDARTQQIGLFEVEGGATALRISPAGTIVAARRADPEEEESNSTPFKVYRTGEAALTVQAVDLQFVDETSALVLRTQPGGMTLVSLTLDGSSSSSWEEKLGNLQRGRIAVSRAAARWRVSGETPDTHLVRFEGAVGGGTEPVRTEWQIPATTAPWSMRGLAASGPGALWVQQEWQTAGLGRFATVVAAVAGQYRVRSRLYVTDASGSRLLADSDTTVSCVDAAVGEYEPVCFASHKKVTNVFGVDLRTGRVRAIGRIDGSVWAAPACDAGAIPIIRDSTPALLRIGDKPSLLRVVSEEQEASFPASAGADIIGAIANEPGRCTVRVFRNLR